METPGYLRDAEGIFSETEREEIVRTIADDPECGDLISRTGGFRKVRFPRSGAGKRGGARVVYILRNESFPIFLTAIFARYRRVP